MQPTIRRYVYETYMSGCRHKTCPDFPHRPAARAVGRASPATVYTSRVTDHEMGGLFPPRAAFV